MAQLYVLVGLPGAGKTTRARQLEAEHRALRLTPDEWMLPLFGDPDAGGKRDVLEGQLVSVALRVLDLGTDVVLDFGVWGREERSALRALAADAGAGTTLVYLPVDESTQLERLERRLAEAPTTTVPLTAEDLASYQAVFSVPTPDELAGRELDEPPDGFDSWTSYAITRWPSLTVPAD